VTIPAKQNESLIEDGTYPATLTNVFRFKNPFGQRIGFEFTLHGQTVEGRTVTRTTTTKRTDKSKLGETIRALTSKDNPNLQALIGSCCVILIIRQRNRHGELFNSVDRIFYNIKLD